MGPEGSGDPYDVLLLKANTAPDRLRQSLIGGHVMMEGFGGMGWGMGLGSALVVVLLVLGVVALIKYLRN